SVRNSTGARLRAAVAAGLTLAVFLGAAWMASPIVSAQPPPFAFVSVLDRNGAPVTDLDPSQVSMTLDGAACTPVTIEPVNWPMKLTVLIDNGAASSEAMPTSLLTAPRSSGVDTSSV